MSVSTTVPSDHDIQVAVQDELEWTPEVEAAGIGVAIERGTVTLAGEVDNFAEQRAAVRAAFRVRGVVAVVDDMSVHPRSAWVVTETDIAKEVMRALKWASDVPETVKAEVKDRTVTLSGTVQWDFQRHAAFRAVEYLRGVRSVINLITLAPTESEEGAQERIRKALIRNAQLDANTIDVTIADGTATLTGFVRSWAEKQQAANAAWASPHISDVDNRIVIRGE